jgi:hypothetical protein
MDSMLGLSARYVNVSVPRAGRETVSDLGFEEDAGLTHRLGSGRPRLSEDMGTAFAS